MTPQELLLSRRTVRRYSDKVLERETLDKAFEMARFCPSWKNTQTVRYTVLTGEKKAKFIESALEGIERNTAIATASQAIIVISTVRGKCGYNEDGTYTTIKQDKWEMFDAGIATQQLCLALHAEGVGSVIMGMFDYDKAAASADIPEGQVVSALVCAGYQADEPKCPPKMEIDELVRYL